MSSPNYAEHTPGEAPNLRPIRDGASDGVEEQQFNKDYGVPIENITEVVSSVLAADNYQRSFPARYYRE